MFINIMALCSLLIPWIKNSNQPNVISWKEFYINEVEEIQPDSLFQNVVHFDYFDGQFSILKMVPNHLVFFENSSDTSDNK